MIRVSESQRGNLLLNHLSQSAWHYSAGITADYEISHSTSVLFLSLKFHAFKSSYIYKRINRMRETRVRMVLILVDSPNYNSALRELFNTVPLPIVLCRSLQECASYIRGLDQASSIPLDPLRRGSAGADSLLSAIPAITKSDCADLGRSFSSLQELLSADRQRLSGVRGLGTKKTDSLLKYFGMPFGGANTGSQ